MKTTTHPTPLPTMAAILALLARCGEAVETAAHALYRHGRTAEIDALTSLACLTAEIALALEARARVAPEHFADALARARALAAYVTPFLTSPVDLRRAGDLLAALSVSAGAALDTDEAEESTVKVPWGDATIAARVYWMEDGPRVSIEGGRDAEGEVGAEVAEAIVGRGRERFDREAVARAGSAVGV